MIGVYIIENTKNGKCYVGASSDIERRWKEHLRSTDNMIIHADMRKIGIDNFKLRVLEECDLKDIYDRESYYINKLGSLWPNGYNILDSPGSFKNGSENQNAVLSESDVFEIREDYGNHIPIEIAYKKVSDKISENGFKSIWYGSTWKEIHMDVYSNENREWHRSHNLSNRNHVHKVSIEDVKGIRELRSKGVKRRYALKAYPEININTFNDIWYYHTFKNIKI